MAETTGAGGGSATRRRAVGLLASAAKHKDRFVQLLMMSGILMMSLRSLSQKHHVRDLVDDAEDLRREHDHLSSRMRALQEELHCDADADGPGALASHLRRIFAAYPTTPAATDDH